LEINPNVFLTEEYFIQEKRGKQLFYGGCTILQNGKIYKKNYEKNILARLPHLFSCQKLELPLK